PTSLDDIVGLEEILGKGRFLRNAIESDRIPSMIFWGPPGSGKTTLARIIAATTRARFVPFSATSSSIKDIKALMEEARKARQSRGAKTIVFIDEIHRFNKAQQDAFLPHIERGTIIFVGATTENPSFELNSALLSRCRVHVMEGVSVDDIVVALEHALQDRERGLGERGLRIDPALLGQIAQAADGDVRRALTLLEIAAELAEGNATDAGGEITEQTLLQVLADRTRRFDKGGEQFYDQISALHKCIRSSNPDAALYWFARMLDGGCDPVYLARRLTRMAVEDIGLADPRALQMAIEAWDAYDRLGSPEGDLALAQVVIYLASTAKSNAAYAAYGAARRDVAEFGTQSVPMHIRNAPTGLMKRLGYGQGYQYDHDVAGGVALDQTGFPEAMGERIYYEPVDAGLEQRLKEKLDRLRDARSRAIAGKRGVRSRPPSGA
ncbi:MAG TPA: replication-associated recombination protein A, partial [Xanthomonadaceae bacterium]|nr:replication-associated recombination protein A [Xanthomonadaceae bacterium]